MTRAKWKPFILKLVKKFYYWVGAKLIKKLELDTKELV